MVRSEEAIKYLESIKLPTEIVLEGINTPPDLTKPNFVNAGSLVSFVGNVNSQNREAILNSCLLAQLQASVNFDRQNQLEQWYDVYTNVLKKIGWTVESFKFEEYSTPQETIVRDTEASTFLKGLIEGLTGILSASLTEILKPEYPAATGGYQANSAPDEFAGIAVLNSLAPVISNDELTSISAAMHSLVSLDDNDVRLTLFKNQSQSATVSNFQLSTAIELNDGVALTTGAFYSQWSRSENQDLWLRVETKYLKIWHGVQKMVLNNNDYAQVSELVKEKLAEKAISFIKHLPDF